MAKLELQTKFIREYHDDDKKLESRWHFDLDITRNGPYLVEQFNLPRKEKKSRKVGSKEVK
jgi:hypothetical protein